MFCINCGAKISDGAKFCAHCGAQQEVFDEQASSGSSAINNNVNINTKLVPAKCTNCGGQLTVNPDQQAAVCPFCNSAFIVEQAINNYNVKMNGNLNVGNATINVQGLNTKNLVARAKAFEMQDDLDNAIIYFNKVLDIDINNIEALQGIERVNHNYVYLKTTSPCLVGSDDIVEVHKDRLTVTNSKGNKEEYFFDQMKNVDYGMTSLQFDYPGHFFGCVTIGCKERADAKAISAFINNAKRGILPK